MREPPNKSGLSIVQGNGRPVRVAMVIGQLTVGGAEGQLSEVVKGIERSRFEPVVYSLSEATAGIGERINGVTVRVVGSSGIERAKRLRTFLVEDRIALVHSWLFLANTYAGLSRLLGVRVPLITSARNCKSQGPAHHGGNVAAFRLSARIIANSHEVQEYIVRRYAAPRARIRVIYNGVDVERFRPAAVRASEPVRIAWVGRLVVQKNPMLLVEAAVRLRREFPELRFLMVGDGPLRQSIAARIRDFGLDQAVEMAGERKDPEECLRNADIFWLTSDWEGLPNVVLEAMASGLPVVATDVGGTREIVESRSEGFLIRPGHVEDLVHYTRLLLQDAALRNRMAGAARARALQFSLAAMIRATEQVYDEALGSEKRDF